MVGFSTREKRELVRAIDRLRDQHRKLGKRVTFSDVKRTIWNLPPKESFWDRVNDLMARLQKKKVCQ